MSLVNLKILTADFPDDKEAIQKIADLIDGSIASGKKSLFSVNRIVDVAGPISQYNLAGILQRLEKEGILKKIIRIETDEGLGIKDFTSIVEVPNSILDWRNDRVIEIAPENLHVYYKVNQ